MRRRKSRQDSIGLGKRGCRDTECLVPIKARLDLSPGTLVMLVPATDGRHQTACVDREAGQRRPSACSSASAWRTVSTVSAVSGSMSDAGTATNRRPWRTSRTGRGFGSISIRSLFHRISRGMPGTIPACRRMVCGITIRPAASMVVFIPLSVPYTHVASRGARSVI